MASVIAWLLLAVIGYQAFAATTQWTEQPGTVYWYKSGTLNKYPSTNPLDFTIPDSWAKQSDYVYIKCTSTGGSNRYYPVGYDCNTGKPKVVKCTAFMCKDDFGITFDLSQNSVVSCPRVQITKEQLALIYDAVKVNNVPACK